MSKKPTYGELEQRVKELEKEDREVNRQDITFEILKALPGTLNVIDTGYNIIMVGGEIARTFKSIKQVIGKKCYKVFQKRDNPCPWCKVDKVLKTGETINETTTPDDHREKLVKKPLSVYIRPLKDKGDNIIGVIEFGTDITQIRKAEEKQKRAEKVLRESEVFLQNVFNAIQDGIIVLDADFTVSMVNWTIEQMYAENMPLVGKKCYEVYQNRNTICERCPTIRAFKSGETEREIVRGPDGSALEWIELFSYPISNASGTIKGVVEFVRDITERKRAEEALQESEEKYRSMMEALAEPAYICTSDFRVSYMNPVIIKRTGYDATGELCYKALSALDEQCPWCVHEKIQQGESVKKEINSPKNGRFFQTSHAPIFHQDGSISKIAIYSDITDLKLAHSALIESKNELEIKASDLEELNAALDVLLEKREKDKEVLEDGVLSNVRTLIEPYIVKLNKMKLPQNQKTLLNILESNLTEIVSPFTRKLSSKYLNLSPSEIQVANLVKHGKTSKEIAEISGVTERTIEFHRENIRKKLGMTSRKTNLKTYLMSID